MMIKSTNWGILVNSFWVSVFLSLSQGLLAAEWSATSVSYLYGSGYKKPGKNNVKEKYDILTLEHVSAWRYGSNFFFTDISMLNSDAPDHYTEWFTGISSKKIFDVEYGGFAKDVLLVGEVDIANGIPKVFLAGIGFDFPVPEFQVFSLNLFYRDNRALKGASYQLTLVWNMSFELVVPFSFQGFVDYAGKEDSSEANLLTQPTLLWLVFENLGLGIEYHYWKNKFGIKGLDESVPQLKLQWTF